GFQHSMILLKDLAEDTLRLFASRGYDPTGVGAEVAFGEGVIGVVAERKRMMRVGSLGAGIAYITSLRARLEAAGEVAPAGAAPTTRSRPTAGKSRSPFSIFAGSPRSRRPRSLRRSWASCASTTLTWASSSSSTRARSSASPATA